MIQKKRKICFIITSFIHYSRNLLILKELNNRDDVDLHIVIAGAVLLPKYASKYANIKDMLERDGFKNIYEIHFNLEGSSTITQAKTAGLAVIEFSTFFHYWKPDLVVLRGDRYEGLAVAMSAAYLNIPVAHIEGGDVSGTIDESVRHAITKLSHIHFATNEPARERIIRMGEDPEYVFNFGSPEIEIIHNIAKNKNNNIDLSQTGSGYNINLGDDYLMVMYHPVTSELKNLKSNTKILLDTIYEFNIPTIWFWPNYDAGSEEISHEIRIFKDEVVDHKIKFMRYLPPYKFLAILKDARCFVGNSSAGIKECSYLGIPVVNIGKRQNNRLSSENVAHVEHNKEDIKKAINNQIKKRRYPLSDIYYSPDTSKNIAEKLATIDLYIQKSFRD